MKNWFKTMKIEKTILFHIYNHKIFDLCERLIERKNSFDETFDLGLFELTIKSGSFYDVFTITIKKDNEVLENWTFFDDFEEHHINLIYVIEEKRKVSLYYFNKYSYNSKKDIHKKIEKGIIQHGFCQKIKEYVYLNKVLN